MDRARLLDGLVTTEFAFIQELVWSPPHKNPFPLCSHSILSRLKNLSAEWQRASPTTRQSANAAMSLIENLDADIKVLIVLRKQCLKLLTWKDSHANTNNVLLAKKVDSILVQHLEDSWNKPSFKLTDTDIQKHKSINQDCLAADVFQLFVPGASHEGQDCNKDDIALENFTVPEADCHATKARELSIEKHYSPSQGQTLLASDEHSAAIPEQESGLHVLTTESIQYTGRQSATRATNNTLQETICTSNTEDNSSTTKLDVTTTSGKCHAPKATLSTSIQAQSEEGTHLSTIAPEVVNGSGRRGMIGTLECFLQTDEDSKATPEAKPNRFSEDTEHMKDYVQAVTHLQDSSSCSNNGYFSAISDDEQDSIIETRVTKSCDYSEIPESAIAVNRAASPMGANGLEISRVQHFSPGAGPLYPREIQIFSSNRDTDGAHIIDEHDLRESLGGGTAGIKDGFESKFAENYSKELVEVEMTLRAKICEPESEEPYWKVIFALLNYSNHKVSVQKLEYWSLDNQENMKCIHWGPGEMILGEQPSFLCHSIKIPCSASNTSPRLAFSWQYSKLPEWNRTKGGKPKLEKGTIRKRFRNMLCLENADKEHKHDTGHMNLKASKKRTA